MLLMCMTYDREDLIEKVRQTCKSTDSQVIPLDNESCI